jgi:hypothetical protein
MSRAAARDEDDRLVDARLVFLTRAAALLHLVEAGEYTCAEAFDRLRPAFAAIACPCAREILDRFARHDLEIRRRAFQDWRWRHIK